MKRHSRALTIISLVLGLILFVYLIKQTGPAEILARVRVLGAGFALIIAISAVRQAARTLAWLRCLTSEARRVGFLALWRARLAGEAIGELTAAGPLIAEPLKVISLGERMPLVAGAASLAVENLAYAVSSCAMILAGTLSLLAAFALSESLRAASLMALVAVLVIAIIIALAISRRWRALSRGAALMGQWLGRTEFGETPRLRELETYVFDFYARRRADFLLVALCELSFHLAGVIEIYATLKLIGYYPSLLTAFILEAVNRIINIIFAFVPVVVGVDEAGTGLLTHTLGLGATAGVALAVIRKVRMFFWIALGLIFLACNQPHRRAGTTSLVNGQGRE
jgi:hypothetical protein